jgi:hypothetical protein
MMFLIETAVRSSLLVLIGPSVTGLSRRQPAALRHRVLALALSLAALQPVLHQVVPSWAVAGWQTPVTVLATAASGAGSVNDIVSMEIVDPAAAPARVSSAGNLPSMLLIIWAIGTALSVFVIL